MSDDIWKYFSYSLGDNLHEMSKPIVVVFFFEKNEKNVSLLSNLPREG